MRKWFKFLISLTLLMITSVAMSDTQAVYADDTTVATATSEATVEFTAGVSILAAPNFDFGINKINPINNNFTLLSAQDDSSYGRSLVIKNDGGVSDWTVSADYGSNDKDGNQTFTYAGLDGSTISGSQMTWNDVKVQKLNDDGTWADTAEIGSDLSTNTIKQNVQTTVFTTNSSAVGTYRLNFPDKASASLTVPGDSQKIGTAQTDMNWTLSASPTS